jgi:alkaline phosphatase D
VVLTGDIHTSWASELSLNPNDPRFYVPVAPPEGDDPADPKGALAIELITPGVTSRAFAAINGSIINALNAANPQFKWYELTKKGFISLSISAEQLSATWSLVESVESEDLPGLILAKTLRCLPAPPGLMRLSSLPSL